MLWTDTNGHKGERMILETKLEVKIKVTVTQTCYVTLRHSKMHPHIKFGISTTNKMRYAPDTMHTTDRQCDYYSKTCLKRSLKNNTNIGFQDQLSLNAGPRGAFCNTFDLH